MSGIFLLIALVVAIALVIFMISKLNIHAFLSLMAVSLLLAIVVGLPLGKIPGIIGSGFSGIFSSIGIVIIFGALIGTILERTGAALKLADMVVGFVGEKRPNLAMLIMGWVVGIPVFCDSGFVVLNPIRKALAQKITQANPIGMAVALSGGLYVSHVLIPPTPGPIAAAGSLGMGEQLLMVILVGVLISIPVMIAVYIFSKFVDKKEVLDSDRVEISKTYEELKAGFGTLPSGTNALMPILAPIVLMALGSIAAILKVDGMVGDIFKFLGAPIIALGVGVICGVYQLYSTKKLSEFNELTNESLKVVGPIIFITAAGGVLGKVITEAGFVSFIKDNAAYISTMGIFFPFIIAAVLKTAQGSSTVAIVTTAAILGSYADPSSMMSALGLTSSFAAALTVMAIGCGAMTVSHANDSYFWVVSNFSHMSAQQGYRTQSLLTLIMGVVGAISVYVVWLVVC
ncbi:GntP family permease [Campylobacter geochelonis]|uniref:GntT protein n=1 Tax=Campylobacter geochelonis TaxID=1780362 RepID=A0A128ECG2_9BACT|nr:GntP family permease [Campylobacter geochelonis]QKF72105.1 GntP family permease, putative gluconate transporter [Campylobacter geochelonis]CZE45908.1 GntT protein [Campylobacter geochelonis]CZE46721.1 GntT protein [Campylobacter geochelonis]CZE49808.1 GntT protein [Campylobacter geochelonis]